MATLLSWHMAKACHDLGDESSAMMHARAAGVSAEQAEHPALSALVHGLKSLISTGPGGARTPCSTPAGVLLSISRVHGTVSVWLPSLEARAAALLGDAAGAAAAVDQAARRREAVEPDDLDELGGLLTFPPQKELYYRVETQVLLGQGATGTATGAAAEQAVAAFSDPDAPFWAFGDEAGARCNLAVVRLHDDELDGTVDALRPVLDLPPGQRNRGIVVSAQRVHHALGHSPARTSLLARELREEITQYAPATPPAAALPR